MDGHSAFLLALPAHPDSITCVRHVLEGLEGHWPVSRALLDDVQIATVEACSNVILHAYRDREAGLLEVRGELRDGQAVVSVRDNGPGMMPRTDSPGMGVGLPLIGALTEALHFGRAPDGSHEVRMTFPRSPP